MGAVPFLYSLLSQSDAAVTQLVEYQVSEAKVDHKYHQVMVDFYEISMRRVW